MKCSFKYFLLVLNFLYMLPLTAAVINNESIQKIVLAGSLDTKDSFHEKWALLVYEEVFRRLGYKLEYKSYPFARSGFILNKGIVDGEINRAFMYQKHHPSLIRVSEPHFFIDVSAFATKSDIVLSGWDSLKNTHYKVDYRRGAKIIADRLDTLVKPQKLSSVTKVAQGIKKLTLHRTDIFICGETLVRHELQHATLAGSSSQSIYNVGLIEKISLHLYLHRKNAVLAPEIAAELKSLKQEGLIEKYKQQALNSLGKQ